LGPAKLHCVAHAPESGIIRYYITDSAQLGGVEPLLVNIAGQLLEGVDMIQIREKDLSTRVLANLTERILSLDNPRGTRILVNSRIDIALACGAHGVHLPGHSPAPNQLRDITPPGFLFGVSCHSPRDVSRAEEEGADFVVLGPVFLTGSKLDATPVGLDALTAASRLVSIPVLALGGISARTASLCTQAGAAGVAGITMFQRGSA
jgi:thiamine-phosphate pyrophosphorylase